MNDTTSGQDASATKLCQVCAKAMPKKGRKCTRCGSWQDWRGELGNVGTTFLSLLLAVFSVFVAASTSPVITDFFTEKQSQLSGAFQSASDQYVSAIISNSGARPGTVTWVGWYFPYYVLGKTDRKTEYWWSAQLKPVTTDGSDAVLIPAAGAQLVRFSFVAFGFGSQPSLKSTFIPVGFDAETRKKIKWSELDAQKTKGQCKLVFTVTNFDASEKEVPQDVDCAKFSRFWVTLEFMPPPKVIQQKYD